MLLLNRRQIYIAGLIVILIYYFIDRLTFIYHASYTSGIVITEYDLPANIPFQYDCDFIKFTVEKKDYYFTGTQYLKYKTGEIVSVIYNNKEIEKAYVFSFMGFWYMALMWCIWPFMIYSALIYGFLRKRHLIILNISFPFFKRVQKEGLQLPEKKE